MSKGRGVGRPPKEGIMKNSKGKAMTREEYAKGRPARVTGSGEGKFKVPQSILDDIAARGCEHRLAMDDGAGSLEKYVAAWWEIYEDANGQQFTLPAGGGNNRHILMIIPKELIQEDRDLRRGKRHDRIVAANVIDPSGPVPDYIPEGKDAVLTREPGSQA